LRPVTRPFEALTSLEFDTNHPPSFPPCSDAFKYRIRSPLYFPLSPFLRPKATSLFPSFSFNRYFCLPLFFSFSSPFYAHRRTSIFSSILHHLFLVRTVSSSICYTRFDHHFPFPFLIYPENSVFLVLLSRPLSTHVSLDPSPVLPLFIDDESPALYSFLFKLHSPLPLLFPFLVLPFNQQQRSSK